jgi:hypothetical protein
MKLAICLVGLMVATLGATELRDLAFTTTAPSCYERVEATFRLTANSANPYDPEEVRVDALIEGPGGARIFPCFYQVPVDTATWREQPAGARWHFRYAFRQEGRYRVRFRVTDRTTWESPATEFRVAGRQGAGFVRLEPANWPDWTRDDGTRLPSLGCNAAWSSNDLIGDYRRWIDAFATNGIRMMRVWLVGFARQELEWSPELWAPWNENYGLGRYNQKSAAWLDTVVDYAAVRGVYLQLVIEQHGEWSTEVDSNWEFNPYNRAHGGFLFTPSEFFTSPRAIRMAHARYRYLVARWGYSPAVAVWELFNEVDNTDAYRVLNLNDEIAAWHRQAARVIKTLDLAPRPVTTSATAMDLLLALDQKAPGLDLLNFHAYDRRPGRFIEVMADAWRAAGGTKPLLCGEFGMPDERAVGDDRGDPVRSTLWQAAFRRVPAWYWYWDIAEAQNRFASYRAYDCFWRQWDVRGWRPLTVTVPDAPRCDAIRLVPGLAWEPSRAATFEVDRFGECVGMGNLSSFLQGSWQREMGQNAAFTAAFNADGRFLVSVGAVAGDGTNVLSICVDDQPMVAKRLQGAGVLGVTLGAGRHTVRVTNTGQDWIQVSHYELTGLAASAIKATGLRSGDQMIVYLCDTRGTAADQLTGLTLVLDDAAPGVYDLFFIDPGTGRSFGRASSRQTAGRLRAPLPPFRGDLAVQIERISP